jgi:hypothetical protein
MSDQDDTDMRMLLRTAGLSLPAERLPVMLESYRRWMEIARVLDEPLAYTDEPAVAFHPEPGVR